MDPWRIEICTLNIGEIVLNGLAIPLLLMCPREMNAYINQKHTCKTFHRSFIYHSPNLETNQMSIKGIIEK